MALQPPSVYRFGEFVVDTGAFRLTRNGEALKTEPKALDVLVCLLERPGQVVSKHDLVADVWKGIAVTDNALTRVVANLRRTLDDHPEHPRYIETVPTRGYRFIAAVVAHEPARPAEVPRASVDTPSSGVPPRRRTGLWPSVALLVVLSGVLGMVLTLQRGSPASSSPIVRTSGATNPRTLAVLPLRNLTGDSGQDYLVDGMTQALGDRFSELGTLTVVSTTSSARYRHSALPVTAIAKELGADVLIEGAVARSSARVRVSVGLVDGGSGRRLWSRQYDRPLADVLALYDEIAFAAASEARLAVEAMDATRRARRPVDPGAYENYLRGMFALGNRWMSGGCQEAEPLLANAVERDPAFAPGHAALAWCYAYPDRLDRDFSEVGPKARAAVSAALALDDRLPLAHAVNGTLSWRMEYDPVRGEAALRTALELDPSSVLVLIPAAEVLMWRGHVMDGLALLDRATRLDPYSSERRVQVGFVLVMAGRYEEAIEHFRRALVLDAQNLTARLWLAEALGYTGRRQEAVAEYMAWLDEALHPAQSRRLRRALERAWAEGGWISFWTAELNLVQGTLAQPGTAWNQHQQRYAGPWFMARRLARLGHWDAALDALEEAQRRRHHLVATLPIEPLFVPLRPASRFQALLRTTGAPLSTLNDAAPARHD